MEQHNNNNVIPFSGGELEEPTKGNYAPVRHNAMKHGILSSTVVLSHEDKKEFSDLLTALVNEHLPSGPTEMHLVEELASSMWRNRRVLLAEGAEINRGLYNVAICSYDHTAKMAVPFNRGMPDKPGDMQDLIQATPEQVAQSQQDARNDRKCTEMASTILRKGGPSAYSKALNVLPIDSREWWEEFIEEGECQPDSQGLTTFIDEHLLPFCVTTEQEALHHHEIKAQALGQGMRANHLEKLARYETHLDRKFERVLAMLIKLTALRRERTEKSVSQK